MNTNPESGSMNGGPAGQNLFWVLLALCVGLGLDGVFRLSDLMRQREQLDQARFAQAQNTSRLALGQQAQARLEPLSIDLLQIAATNDSARRIVQEFGIMWNPDPSAPMPAAGPASRVPALSAPPPTSSSLLGASNNLQPTISSPLPASTNPPPVP